MSPFPRPKTVNSNVVALACIPSIDCIVNQLANGLQLSFGPISALQLLRGGVLLWLIGIVLIGISRDPERIRAIPGPAIGALVLLAVFISKQWLLVGTIEAENCVAYGQMAYWVVLWIAVSVTCTLRTDALAILYGIASGAVMTALSVFVGSALGTFNYYENDLVQASSGWFVTAKMITGILVCGTAVLLYLGGIRRPPWLYGVLACLCSVGVLATYARAGAVALLALVLCLGLWAIHRRDSSSWRALSWFLGLCLAGVVLGTILIGPATVFSRWNDMGEGEQAGSGRVAIWTIAVEAFRSAPVGTQALGNGYEAMSELLFRQYGMDVKHTHNDGLDMLLVGGIAGLLWLASFVWTWAIRIGSFGKEGIERVIGAMVLTDYLCHGQLTGQLWGTDSMSYYVLSLTALAVIASTRQTASGIRHFVISTSPVAA